MPTVTADRLKTIVSTLLVAAGASPEEAEIISTHSVGANLAGHDSHGAILIPTYIERIEKGHIVPGAPMDVIQENATTTVIDGNWGFGYVVSEHAMKTTIAKAAKSGVGATTVFRQSHIGRLADYPLMAAKAGMIGLITADSGRSPKNVAPFGGREARLGTNPISIAVPSNLDGPFYIDMATSAAAAGKIKVAEARGKDIPLGWVIDKDGKHTTDPSAFTAGGALLPLGGVDGGYKGYGLGAMVEIFCGLLTGLGFGVEPTGRHNDGVFMAAFNVSAFRPLEQFKAEVTDFANYLKSTPLAEGFDEILYPGEIEHRQTQKCLREGIAIEDKTWARLKALAEQYKVQETLRLE